MAQFDVYANPNPNSRDWAPFLVDLQHDMLGSLATRVMAPLLASKPAGEPTMQYLNPTVRFDSSDYFVSTAELASVPTSELSDAVGNLSGSSTELLAAVDLLFTAV